MNSKQFLIIAAFLNFPHLNAAEEESIPLSFSEQLLGKNIELDGGSDTEILRIAVNPTTRGKFHLFDIDAPAISGDAFAVEGEVRCEGLTETGYLEMWTHLPTSKGAKEVGTSFFSRTAAPSGPMASLREDQDWRLFRLPAYINDGSERRPLKLTLNAILPGQGVVELRKLRLLPSIPISPQTGSHSIQNWLISGVAFFLGGVLVGGMLFFFRRRKTRAELSRIRNLDAV